jgi:hypothetical protein
MIIEATAESIRELSDNQKKLIRHIKDLPIYGDDIALNAIIRDVLELVNDGGKLVGFQELQKAFKKYGDAKDIALQWSNYPKYSKVFFLNMVAMLIAMQGQIKKCAASYADAGKLFDNAAEQIYQFDLEQYQAYKARAARAYFLDGDYKGETSSLVRCEQTYNELLKHNRLQHKSEIWIETSINLGDSLRIFGERKTDKEYLLKAEKVFTDVLEAKNIKLDVAKRCQVHSKIAYIKRVSGERSNYPEDLLESIDIYDEILKTYKADGMFWSDEEFSSMLNDYAIALHKYGKRETDNKWLELAKEKCEKALDLISKETNHLIFAGTHNNLGNILLSLGERVTDDYLLQESLKSYDAALSIWQSDKYPLKWALSSFNLGSLYRIMGERRGAKNDIRGAKKLIAEAVEKQKNAIKSRNKTLLPIGYAVGLNSLGNSYRALGEITGKKGHISEAWKLHSEANRLINKDQIPRDWVTTQNHLARILRIQGEKENNPIKLEESIGLLENAFSVFRQDQRNMDWARTRYNLAKSLTALGKRTGDKTFLERAEEALLATSNVYEEDDASYFLDQVKQDLDLLHKTLDRTNTT